MRVPKTIKLYINGAFPRTESGRSYPILTKEGELYANLCDATRKDLRSAVEAAKTAYDSWSAKSAYNRGQILYRVAEMISSRESEFVEILVTVWGLSENKAAEQVQGARDAFVYYAGFTDKFQQLWGSVNPVSGPHHNFTSTESVGVVGFVPSAQEEFSKTCAHLAAVLAGGNVVVAIFSEQLAPLLAPLSEVLETSDFPAGVVNLLTESKPELLKHLASHMEVQSLGIGDHKDYSRARKLGVDNMKRVVHLREDSHQLACITDFVEFKTVWHPIGV